MGAQFFVGGLTMGIKTFLWLTCLVSASIAASRPRHSRTPWDSLMQRLRREVVDLHSGEFCVDVSTFGEVSFEPTPREKCDTTFEKQCETKSEQVCDEVTEISCEIVPYTECEMSMEETPYKSFETITKQFPKKVCKEGMDVVQHTKMMPECRNVTKQNCITKWETDENGNQVWAGNEACEPVTWRECKLVPRQVDFKVPKISCEDGEEVPYQDMQDAEKTQMTTKMTCEVKHTANCKPVTSTKCQSITCTECAEIPQETCETVQMQVPKQEKEHKKKCLLPDNGSGLPLPRGNTPNAALSNLDASVAAVKAQSLDEEVAEESQKVYAKPLPLNPQQQPQQSQYKPRSGRRFQQPQNQQRFAQQQQQRFSQQQQHNGQFV